MAPLAPPPGSATGPKIKQINLEGDLMAKGSISTAMLLNVPLCCILVNRIHRCRRCCTSLGHRQRELHLKLSYLLDYVQQYGLTSPTVTKPLITGSQ